MEIITGIERRRRWRLEDKLRIIAETEQPGASVAEVARRHEISRSLIWNWRSRARCGTLTAGGASAFLPVQVVSGSAASVVGPAPAPAMPLVSEGQIEISLPDGSRVRVGNDVGLAALRRVMSVLRG